MRSFATTFLTSLVLLASAPLSAGGERGGDEFWLEINIPALRLTVWQGERLLRAYPISVGLPDFSTPSGSFEITRAEWNPWWHPPTHREWAREEEVTPPGPNNPMGRVKLFFLPLYFIHGTPEHGSIGTPASHGCVRMLDEDVIELARLLHERADATVGPGEIDAILDRPALTRHARFKAPVRLRIRYQPVVVEDGDLVIYPDIYGWGRIHAEGVYQALLAAGVDPAGVARSRIRAVLEAAGEAQGEVYRVSLEEAFGAVPSGRVSVNER
ncbi:MAG: L,D-transpeptidase [Longimicrobiaceae bacterium]